MNNKRPIVIVAAMDAEYDFLLNKLENIKYKSINKYNFYEGTINNYPTVIVNCKVMSINAAIATYIAIENYNPIAIINEGTAGGHGEDVHKGDIVVGENCINIVSTNTPIKSRGEGSNSLEWNLVDFISGEENRLVYKQADKKLIKLAKEIEYLEGKVHFGTIGSGDVWNREADRIFMLNQKYGTLCEEMEGIAVYTVANNFNIPVIGIRIVSNNEILGEVYERSTGRKSQEFTYELIKKIISKEEKKKF